MTEGSIFRTIFLYSLPLIAGNFLQQLYNAFDSVIVGNFVGETALAAVGASGQIIYFLISFSLGISTGAGIIISFEYGARHKERLQDAVHTTLFIALALGLIITFAGIFLSPVFLKYMGTPDDMMKEAIIYLRIFFGGMVFNVLYNMAAGILNAAGNSGKSLMFLAIASGTNIVLDVLLVGLLRMGVAGAAIATDISQALSCILVIGFLVRTDESYKVTLRRIRWNGPVAARIIRVGIPTGIQNAVISLSNVLIQTGVNSYGTSAAAGFAAYLKIDGFNILPIMSFSLSATTFISQNIGAGKQERVRKGIRTIVLMTVFYTLCSSSTMLFFGKYILRIFSRHQEVLHYGMMSAYALAPFYTLLGLLHSLAGCVRGSGKTLPPMVIILLSLCVFRILWLTFAAPHFQTLRGVLFAYPASFILGSILMTLYAWKGKWLPWRK